MESKDEFDMHNARPRWWGAWRRLGWQWRRLLIRRWRQRWRYFGFVFVLARFSEFLNFWVCSYAIMVCELCKVLKRSSVNPRSMKQPNMSERWRLSFTLQLINRVVQRQLLHRTSPYTCTINQLGDWIVRGSSHGACVESSLNIIKYNCGLQ